MIDVSLVHMCQCAASDQILKIQEGIMDLQRLTSIDGVPCVQLIPRPSNAYPDYVNVENYSG